MCQRAALPTLDSPVGRAFEPLLNDPKKEMAFYVTAHEESTFYNMMNDLYLWTMNE